MAAGLRLSSIKAGLPGLGLSPDENTVASKSIAMIADRTPNPGWFLYPSLYLYLTAGALLVARPFVGWPDGTAFASTAAYAHDATAYVLAGRLLSVAFGLAFVVAVWLLGRSLAGQVAGAVAAGGAAVSPIAVHYSHLAVTDMAMTALLTFGLWQMVEAARRHDLRPVRRAALLIGLATSAKYNAGAAIVPLAALTYWIAPSEMTRRRERLRRVGAVVGRTVGAFLVGTPFAVLTPGAFLSDFVDQNRIVADGWLGFEHTGPGWRENLHPVLWNALGGGLAVASILAVAIALLRGGMIERLLAGFAVGYLAYVSLWNAHFDRYLLPAIPVLLAVAGWMVARGAERLHRGRRVALTAAALAMAAPAALGSLDLLRDYRLPDHRTAGAQALTALIPTGTTIVTDPLGLPLLAEREGRQLSAAGANVRWYRIITLATPQPGRLPDPLRSLSELRRGDVRWVVTSRDIERRVLAAADRYPREARFYRELSAGNPPTLDVPDGLRPGVRLWRLGPARTPGLDARP